MNAMGHDVPTFIGVDKKEVAEKIRQFRPGIHAHGHRRHGRYGRNVDGDTGEHDPHDERAGGRMARSKWVACSRS